MVMMFILNSLQLMYDENLEFKSFYLILFLVFTSRKFKCLICVRHRILRKARRLSFIYVDR